MASNLLELMRVINDVIRLLGSPSFPSLPGDFTFQPTERQIDTSRILCRLCGAHLLMDQTPESAQHQILRKKSTKGIRFCGEMGSMGDEPGWNVELGGGQYKSRSLSLSLSFFYRACTPGRFTFRQDHSLPSAPGTDQCPAVFCTSTQYALLLQVVSGQVGPFQGATPTAHWMPDT